MKTWMFLVGVAVLPACMGGMDSGADERTAEVQGALVSMRHESARHTTATAATTGLDELRTEAQLHSRLMNDHLGRMSMAGGGMRCQMGSAGLDTDVGRMRAEVGDHQRAELGASTLAEGRAECLAHADRVELLLGEMGSVVGHCGMMN